MIRRRKNRYMVVTHSLYIIHKQFNENLPPKAHGHDRERHMWWLFIAYIANTSNNLLTD